MTNYYDIDDIIADGQNIPCKFQITVPGLGFLEGNPGQPLQEGAKLDLPLWLAEILATVSVSSTEQGEQETFLDLIQPEFYSNKVLNAIKTGPDSINLHAVLQHFYKITERWGLLFNDKELVDIVIAMLKHRASLINDLADSGANSGTGVDFFHSLDETERALFKQSYHSHKKLKEWLKN